MKPLVSILIPAHNAQRWIRQTLKSAVSQTWPRTEIVVVDDGSTDRTLEIARTFRSAAVEVLTQSNQGASAARNRAFAVCQGDYVQWLDADDLLHPDKITRQMAPVERGCSRTHLLSSTWGTFFHRTRKAQFIPTVLWQDHTPVSWLVGKLRNNAWMAIESWLISRELTQAGGPWNTRLAVDDDGEYFARLVSGCDGVAFVAEARSFVRRVGFNTLSCGIEDSPRKQASQLESMKTQMGYLRRLEDSETTRAACLQYLQDCLVCFSTDSSMMQQCHELAAELGGTLAAPAQEARSAALTKLLGVKAARQAQNGLRRSKANLVAAWDGLMHRWE